MGNVDKDNRESKNNVIKINLYGKTKELGRVIGLNGTMEILDLLDERPRKYTEIELNTKISHATLIERLQKLQELSLIKKNPITSKRRETHLYDFTLRGVELMKFVNSYEKVMNLSEAQQKLIELMK